MVAWVGHLVQDSEEDEMVVAEVEIQEMGEEMGLEDS